jgi:hypothetical protein
VEFCGQNPSKREALAKMNDLPQNSVSQRQRRWLRYPRMGLERRQGENFPSEEKKIPFGGKNFSLGGKFFSSGGKEFPPYRKEFPPDRKKFPRRRKKFPLRRRNSFLSLPPSTP